MGILGLFNRRASSKPIRKQRHASREDSFRSRINRSLKIEQFEERTLLSIGTWEPLGPAPVDYADSQVENVLPEISEDVYLNQVVGSITAVAAHPTNPDILYVGTTNGGIWRTDDATAPSPTWTQLTDDAESLSIGALVFDPTDPTHETLVAGIGRFSDYYRQGGELTGLIRTTNGGEAWTPIDGDGVLDGRNCISIAVRGDTILIAVDNAATGAYASVGLFRSEDGGETFNQISDGDGSVTGLPGGITYDLAADPSDPEVFYTAVVGADTPGGFGGENGIYKSEDGGESWLKISSDDDVDEYLNSLGENVTHRVQLSVGTAGQLYVGILNQSSDSPEFDELAAIFRTGDGGENWTEMDQPTITVDDEAQTLLFERIQVLGGDTMGTLPSGQGAVHFSIVADPDNDYFVYIGCDSQPVVGEDSPFGAEVESGLLYLGKALAAEGEQWVHITHDAVGGEGGTASGSAPHAESRDMAFDALGRLIEVDDGGIYVRTNPQSNTGDWASLNGNLQISEVHDIAYDSVSNVAIAGTQNAGVTEQTETGSLVWSEVSGGDGGDVAVDEVSLAESNQTYRYSSGTYFADFIRRTVDADNVVIETVTPALSILDTSNQDFYSVDGGQYRTPFAINMVDPSRIAIGGSTSVFESSDRGETLANLSAAANANAIVYGGYRDGVANASVMWVATDNGVFIRTSAAGVLTQIATGRVLDIAVDPTDWSHAFVITDAFIYEITNASEAGGTIVPITGDYTGVGLRTIEYFSSGDSGAVIVGGVQGVHYSEMTDLGHWETLGENLPNAPVMEIEYDATDNVLVVGTLGRGVWQLEDPRTEIFGSLQLISVSTNTNTYQATESPVVNVAPTELTLRFNDTTINADTLSGIVVTRAGANGTFYDPADNPYDIDDVVIEPGYIAMGDNPNEVLIRFAETLPDDVYHITIVGQGGDGIHYYYGPDGTQVLPFTNLAGVTVGYDEVIPDEGGSYWDGNNFVWTLDLNLGPQVTGVVQQPISRDPVTNELYQARNKVEVYFSDFLDTASAETLAYYSLIATQDTANTSDDVVVTPTDAVYDAAAKKVTLTFGLDSQDNPVNDLADVVNASDGSSIGSFRLRIGGQYREIVATERTDVQEDLFTDVGSTFDDAADLGSFTYTADPLNGQSWLISGQISPVYYDVEWPGGRNTPGNRDLPEYATDVDAESHTYPDTGDEGPYGEIPTYYYNFKDVYAIIQNSPAHNLISEIQKERVREIFSLISYYGGVQFTESVDQGMTIVTGDLRAFDSEIDIGPGSPAGMAGGGPEDGLVIVNSYYNSYWGDSEYGGNFMQVMMHEILHPLGLMHSYELPSFEIMGSSETVDTLGTNQEATFPGNNDIAVLQYLYRKDSLDTDYYKFEIESEGDLSVEAIAQRLQSSSLLDTNLVLYNDQFQAIASNDDYFDDDSFIGVHLQSGTYYIGISSTGNSQYAPDVDGGTTEGTYQLRMDFQPQVQDQLTSSRGVAVDGDADGLPGGQFDYWFDVATAQDTLIVDKLALDGGDGSQAAPFNTISAALAAAEEGDIVRVVGNNFANDNQGDAIQAVAGDLLVDGKTFTISDANRTFTFELDNDGNFTQDNIQVAFTTSDTPATVAATLTAVINSVSWIPEGLSEVSPERYSEGLYARATVDAENETLVNVNGPTVTIDLGSTKLETSQQDNLAYEIGIDPYGTTLDDGRRLEVPKGVSLIIDAGAIFKLRSANISVGSAAVNVDRSQGSLQVLGMPGNDVVFTSYLDERVGKDTYSNTTVPSAGNWGGLVFRNNYDYDEQADDPSRVVLEQEGIFLNYVNHADIRYGGGKVTVNGVQDVYNPIHMTEARPTVAYSTIRYSADAAMSADPNSLLETTFHDEFGETIFSADYDRVGPDIHGNHVSSNTFNALLLRVATAAANSLEQVDVSARFDDVDIVLVIPENLVITGDVGVAIAVTGTCPLTADSRNELVVPDLTGGDNPFVDRQWFVIDDGINTVEFEFDLAGNGVTTGREQILLSLNPQDPAVVAAAIADAINNCSELNIQATADGDRVVLEGTSFDIRGLSGTQARMGGRLSIDPGAVVKLGGSRVEVGIGAQFIAEGANGYEVVFTSMEDDVYGAGGTFDTRNNGETAASAGDWGGIYFHPTSRGSIDQARIYHAGGSTAIEGGFGNFAPIDIRQATVRVTNTLFEDNIAAAAGNRNGRGEITEPALIHVLFSQPVIAGNTFVENDAPLISIDVNSLNYLNVADWGRATGFDDSFDEYGDNHGPLVRENRMADNTINGMIVRGGTLTTEGIWDDTDMVHVVYDEIIVTNLCTYGGLRLQSSADESLVIKLSGSEAGFTATGRPLEIDDRIGGTIQVVGTAGHPVVFTDLADDTVGAGLTPDNMTVLDTDNTGESTGTAGAWRSIKLEEFSNDRNVAVINETEPATVAVNDANADPNTAEWLGLLAAEDKGGDETVRLGFEVHGDIALDRPDDVDVYSFQGYTGAEVWIQIDRTTISLDTVIELLDAEGNVLARSDNWRDEVDDPNLLEGIGLSLERDDWGYEDVYSINRKDAGMRVVLPGPDGLQRTYYIRVSSVAPTAPGAHQTSGEYQLQVRLRDIYEHPGSTISFADIRYATNGIEVIGLPGHSPLTSDIYETEAPDNPTTTANDTFDEAQAIGNLLQSDNNQITVGGYLEDYTDVDWYKIDLSYGDTIQRIAGYSTEGSVYPVTFDIDYADGLSRPDTTLWIFDETGSLILMGTDSGIVDDQPDPTEGKNLDDLERGSVGIRDPFIGPVYLLEGHSYYVAVTSTGATAAALDDPMMRLEPIDSIQRIAEDNVGDQNASGLEPNPPYTLFPGDTALELNLSAVPFHLGDVTFYVLTDGDLFTADPFTGALETDVTDSGNDTDVLPDAYNADADNAYTYGDIVMLSNGKLYSVTRGVNFNATVDQNVAAGRLRELDTGDARVAVSDQDDGLLTYRYSTAPDLEVAGDNNPQNEAGGVRMEAIVPLYDEDGNLLNWYVVGNANNGYGEVMYQDNLLYKLTPDGTAVDPGTPPVENDPTNPEGRLPTNIIPVAQLTTEPAIATVNATDTTTDLTEDPDATLNDVLDGTQITVYDADGNMVTVELDCGPDVDMGNGALAIRDGMTFTAGGTTGQPVTFEFDSGPVLIIDDSISDGDTFTITDNDDTPVTTIYEIDTNGNAGGGDVIISVNGGWSTTQIGEAIVAAINGAGTTVVAALGDATATEARVSLINDTAVTATQFHMNVLPDNPVMRLGNVKDGDTFTVLDPGGTPTTFEFDTGDGVGTDNVPVLIPNPDGMEVQGPNALVQFSNAMTDGTTIALTDSGGNTTTFEFDTDGNVTAGNVTIDISVSSGMVSQGSTPLLQFNKNISDGDTFTVDGTSSQTFELDSNGSVTGGNVAIPFDPVPSSGLSVQAGVPLFQFKDPVDGSRFTVAGPGGTMTFEFDTDGAVGGGNTAIDVSPVDGLNVQPGTPVVNFTDGVTDEETFTVDVGGVLTTFEFDTGDDTVAPGNVMISVDPAAVAADIATAAVEAVNNEALGVNALNTGNGIGLADATDVLTTGSHVRPVAGGCPLVVFGPSTVTDGDTLTIDGTTFEFDSNGSTTAGNTLIDFPATGTIAEISAAAVTAINGAGIGVNAVDAGSGHRILLANASDAAVCAPLGSVMAAVSAAVSGAGIGVNPMNTTADTLSMLNATSGSASGVGVQYLGVSPILLFGGATVSDGDIVTINGTTFEFDTDGSVSAGNMTISFAPSATIAQIMAATISSINSAGIGVTAMAASGNSILLSGATSASVRSPLGPIVAAAIAAINGSSIGVTALDVDGDRVSLMDATSASATGTGVQSMTGSPFLTFGSSVDDGDTLMVTNGAGVTTPFEFDSDGSVAAGSVAITFAPSDTIAQITAKTITTINAAGVSVTAVDVGGGRILLANATKAVPRAQFSEIIPATMAAIDGAAMGVDTIEVENNRVLMLNVTSTVTDGPGVQLLKCPPVLQFDDSVEDGYTITITDGGGVTTIFEFDDNGLVGTGNTPISFTSGDSVSDMIDAAIQAITDEGIAVEAIKADGDRIVLLGANDATETGENTRLLDTPPVVVLGATVNDGGLLTVTNADGDTTTFEFDSNGMFAADNIQIEFLPGDTISEIVGKAVDAINAASIGVTAKDIGNGRLLLIDAAHAALGNTNIVAAAVMAVNGAGIGVEAIDVGESRVALISATGLSAASTQIDVIAACPVLTLTDLVVDGETFTITYGTGETKTFEFDNNGVYTTGHTPIAFIQGQPVDMTMAETLAVVNGSTPGVNAVDAGNGRIVLVGVSKLTIAESRLYASGDYGVTAGHEAIPFEETWDDAGFQAVLTAAPLNFPAFFGDQVANFVNTALRPNVIASAADRETGNDRITFSKAVIFDISGMATTDGTPVWTIRDGEPHPAGSPAPLSAAGAQNPAAPNQEVVLFGAGDTADEIAQKIADAINQARTDFPPFNGSANAKYSTVFFDNLSLRASEYLLADAPFTVIGNGPGGKITGLAFMPDSAGVQHLYAVSSGGGLYEVVNYDQPAFVATPDLSDPDDEHTPREIKPIGNQSAGAHLRYIGLVESDQNPGQYVEFAGLTLGPQNVEESKYAEMFFAVSRTGDVYALSIDGGSVVKESIFVDGQTSITIPGLTDVSGLAFSTLDFNMWHATERRKDDDGHDVNPTYDLSRAEPPPEERDDLPEGNWSFYFGDETDEDSDANDIYTQLYGEANPYLGDSGTPDGTYDAPGGAYGSLVTQTFSLAQYSKADAPTLYFDYFLETDDLVGFDTARVFASADGVNWYVLGATLENPEANLLDTNGQWNQLRLAPPEDPEQEDIDQSVYFYSLADFVGESEVRLRFDFSTSGDMHVGDSGNMSDTTGAFLQAVVGDRIEDGDLINVDGEWFEFDMGVALRLPNVAGDAVADGETFTIMSRNAGGTLVPLQTFEFDNDGQVSPGNMPITIESGETTTQVVERVASVVNGLGLMNSFGELIVADVHENRVMLNRADGLEQSADPTIEAVGDGFRSPWLSGTPIEITSMMSAEEVAEAVGDSFDAVFAGGESSFKVQGSIIRMIHHAVWDSGPLPYSNVLPGDTPYPLPENWVDRFNRITRGQDNAYEGFYIDNVTIGFAERGEMATQAPVNTDFVFTEEAPETIISTGYYQLNIHRASEYATWAPEYLYPMVLDRSFDTNDRFSDSYTLTVLPANDIPHGSTFKIGDGVTTLTFQFLDENVQSGNPDYEPIYFSTNMTASEVAHVMVEAINNASAAGLFNVTATMNEYSNLVDLFGAATVSEIGGISEGLQPGGNIPLISERDDPLNFDLDTSEFMALADAISTGTAYMLYDEWGGTWSDAEKTLPDDPDGTAPGTGDDFLCWAASAANILAWSGWGSAYGGDADEIFQYYEDHWTDEGGWQDVGWIWWFNGTNVASGWGASEVDVPGGGFYPELDYENYIRNNTDDAQAMSAIDEYLHEGYGTGLAVYSDSGMAHAITAWGYNYDEADPDHYVGIWVTDSDDDKAMTNAPDVLHYYEVEWSETDGRWYMQDYYGYYDVYIGTVTGLALRYNGEGASARRYTEQGDQNQVHDQGQVIIENSVITNSAENGITASATDRGDDFIWPSPSPTAPLATINSEHQVPGVVIRNNIVAFSAEGGIQIEGDSPNPGESIGSTPFVRIINNTVYGTGSGFGISIEQNASATILNNIVANTQTGISVDSTSLTTVVGTTAYADNAIDLVGVDDTFPIYIQPGEPLFVDADAGNFYPAAGSRIIDSSLDSLQDRANMVAVKDSLGLPSSPIIAPTYDILGQLRKDNPYVSDQSGVGDDTFKDRGAIDRVDEDGPTAVLITPTDNDAAGIDLNTTAAEVLISVVGNVTYPKFIIQLQEDGAGIFDDTVLPEYVQVTRDGVELVEGRDYFFDYDNASDQIILASAGNAWASGSTYLVTLTDGIRDLADNPVQYTRPDDTTSFVITLIGYDFGDAPMGDETKLPDGARHVITPGVHLGNGVDAEATPQPDTAAEADKWDDGVDFIGGDYVVSQPGKTKTISVTASTDGYLDAWIDWNANGSWEASEKIELRDTSDNSIAATGIVEGTNELTFDVPDGLATSEYFDTYVRFRFTTSGTLADGSAMLPTGEASDGEVEDYRITVVSNLTDWGDAPDPTYPTLQTSGGASHIITDDALYLGDSVTFDLEANPNADATGDEGDNGFDFSEVSLIQGRETEIDFTVVNDLGTQAYLHAWIDYNGDGVWSGSEKLVVMPVEVGENTLTFTVPAGAAVGDTFVRFRLSTEQTLLPTGPAADGEVEDYLVTIEPTPGNIQGYVYNDVDGEGDYDTGEEGLEGWTVYIDANNNEQFDAGERSVLSGVGGFYEFIDVAPGTHLVRQLSDGGWTQTGPVGGFHTVVLASDTTESGINFFNQDTVPPTVTSIVRHTPADEYTNVGTVQFLVQFSEPVSGVDIYDFDYADTELSGVSITLVEDYGSDNDQYLVTVTTSDGNGELQLTLIDDDSIIDGAGLVLGNVGVGNGDFLDGESYMVDRISPKAASIELVGDETTNADTVTFTVTFVEPVTGVDETDFELVADAGLTGATIDGIVGDGTIFTVTVNTGAGQGELRLNLLDDNTILDLAGNVLVGEEGIDDGSLTGPAYKIDHIAPMVESIAPAGASPTHELTVLFTVIFDEPVTGVTADDFALTATGLNGSTITGVTGSGNTYQVSAKTGTGSIGTLRLDLIDDNTIRDLAGNVLVGKTGDVGDFTEGVEYEIDRTRPTGIFLTNDMVAEGMPINTVVGILSSTGPNEGEYQYELVDESGNGEYADNEHFYIATGVLRTNETFDYDAKSSYKICIRTTDSAGKTRDQEFTITIVEEEDTVTIGDKVWHDDGDGIQEIGEPGVEGTTVELIVSPNENVDDDANYTYAQTVTGENGEYQFDNVLPGLNYFLVFRSPVGYTFTEADVGDTGLGDIDSDSDADAAGYTDIFTLAAGEVNLYLDAGLVGAAEAYDFAIPVGAGNDDLGQSVATDTMGNVYVTGTFKGTVDFDPGTGVYSLTSAGDTDVFVAKYSSKGALIWAKAMGGIGTDAANSISVNSEKGMVCVAGSFSDTADFISGPGEYNLTSAGSKDAFVMKLDSLGGLMWARGMGGEYDEVVNDVAIGADGSVYSTGYFAPHLTGTDVDFDPGEGVYNLTSIGKKDIFISKLDSNGDFVWAKRTGGTGWAQGMSVGMGIAVNDTDKTVYVTGSFEGTADFDPSVNQYTLTCAGATDTFISHLDADGNFLWAKRIGSTYGDYGADIALSPTGDVLVTGGFQGVVDFDPGAGTTNLSSETFKRLYALKLTDYGNFVWAAAFGGTATDLAGDITTDDAGAVYVSGGFQGNADFNPGAGVQILSSTGQKDAFVLKLDSAGQYQWAKRTGGIGDDCANGIAVHSESGSVYTTGYFTGQADFDPESTTYQLTSAGLRDAFVAKYVAEPVAPLTVTIDQAAGQADPAVLSPIVFRVVFSAPVTDFSTADVAVSGVAGAYVLAVTPVGTDGTTYDVSVTGMTESGTVTATIPAAIAHDSVGTANSAATHTDNQVDYNYTAPVGPSIPDIQVVEDPGSSDGDGVLETTDQIVVTWHIDSPNGVASRTLKVDGQPVTQVGVPDVNNNCWGVVAPLTAGPHTVAVTVTDNNGVSRTEYKQFTVATPSTTSGPSISDIQVVEDPGSSDGDGVLETTDQIVVTWHIDSPNGVASRTLKVDGQPVTQVGVPDVNNNCWGVVAPLTAGPHTVAVTVTDNNGVSHTEYKQFTVFSALTLETTTPTSEDAAAVTGSQIGEIVSEAARRLEETFGAEAASILAGVSVEVADLPGNTLGTASDSAIIIDTNAAGYGWFVDQTPAEDEEFFAVSPGNMMALSDSLAVNRADLLTTVMHEMEHVLGFEHTDEGLMEETLGLSTRKLPSQTDLMAQAFASLDDDENEFDWL